LGQPLNFLMKAADDPDDPDEFVDKPVFQPIQVLLDCYLSGFPNEIGEFATRFHFLSDLPYLEYALRGRENEMPEINDMVPGSAFITERVVNSDGKTRTASVEDGYQTVIKIGWVTLLGIPLFPYLYRARVTKYKLVTVYDGTETLRIGPDMPIGYLVGLNSNTFSMDSEKEETMKKAFEAIEVVLGSAMVIHMVKNLGIFGLFTGSPTGYDDAVRAYNYVRNIDANLNKLKGSSNNDGLVALESQYYPKAIHSNVLLGEDKGYEGFSDYNHKSINDSRTEPDSVVQRTIERMVEDAVRQRKR